MTQDITVFIDDQDPQIQYLCPSIHQRVLGSYYNNTWSSIQNASCNKGWFQYTFYGTGVHVSAAVAVTEASYSVKIDDGEFVAQSGVGIYDSPILPDGKHSITYAIDKSASPPAFDYLAVTAGKSTALAGHILAVDDADSSIIYSGSWSNKPAVPAGLTDSSISLYRNTVHWTSTVGDSLQLQFEGSSISVLGIASNISSGGNITATYTLDGVTKTEALPRGTLDTVPMINLFHEDVQPGIHSLIINITDIQAPASLGIDLITYNATFDSIASVPANASPLVVHPGKSLDAGAKVGVVIGTLVGIMALASLAYVLGRRYLGRRNPKFPLSDTLESGTKMSSQPSSTW